VIARLASQKAKFKSAWQTVTAKVAGLEKAVTDLTAERDQLKTQSDPTAASKQVEALNATIRGMKTRAAFDSAALKEGASPAALEDLWKLAEVKADADEPDLAAITATITAQKAARAWAFGATPPPLDPNAPPPPRPAAGSGQGGANGAPAQFSEAQLNDPKFVMQNFDKIALASTERIARGEV
jgi:hypothetical protein